MRERSKKDIRFDLITASLSAVLLIAATGLVFGGFWYDINDDVLMRDILAGYYTGVPEGYNIQMLYPLSLVLSACYRTFPALDWYAVFLCAVHALCLAVTLFQILCFFRALRAKVLVTVLFVILYIPLLAPHVVFVQYTFTCAWMCAVAAFLLLTSERDSARVLSLLLLWCAFCLRSEMMIFMLPLVLVAVALRLRRYITEERVQESGVTGWKRYLLFLIILAAGLGVLTVCHRIAYSPPDWQEFIRLFDNRTELYDFQEIPDYETHRAFFEGELGLSKEQHALLINYNYGLDESIDADTLGRIAEYAASLPRTEGGRMSWTGDYLHRLRDAEMPADWLFPGTDAPYNICVFLMYLLTLCVLLRTGIAWKLLLLFACRTALWGYLLARGRAPVRITHGLYLVELLVLAGLLLPALSAEIDPLKQKVTVVITIALLAVSLLYLLPIGRMMQAEHNRRLNEKIAFDTLFDTLRADADHAYWIDVFTWVPYTDRLFTVRGQEADNYDIMGGWAAKSPLYEKKLAALSLDNMRDSLPEERAYFVQEEGKDVAWLSDYYAEAGIAVEVTEVETIADRFVVYRLAHRHPAGN